MTFILFDRYTCLIKCLTKVIFSKMYYFMISMVFFQKKNTIQNSNILSWIALYTAIPIYMYVYITQ